MATIVCGPSIFFRCGDSVGVKLAQNQRFRSDDRLYLE
jgi:hypothetical protein